jgi:hypothetical protein
MEVPSKPWSVNKSKATSRILSRVDAPAGSPLLWSPLG